MNVSPVSIHPYFKAHPGMLDVAKALLPRFVEKTATETKVLHYEFTIREDEIFCREAYQDAEATLAHLENVGALIGEMLQCCDLIRVELHGPAVELEKLREPLSHLNAAWFTRECGLDR